MPSIDETNKVTYFAFTDARNKKIPFGIKAKDRTKHTYVIGKTGMGKSTVLENMAIQDIQNGNGLAFIDPHGKTAELLLEYVPESRIKDVLYFAPFDTDFPISFNVMEDVGEDKRHLVVNGLMSAFKKIWVDAWSARMEYILNNILLALLEYPGSTLIGVNRMLSDKDYRKKVVANVKDPSVKAFWVDEFAKYGERYMQEAGAAIQNKIGQFISNPIVRNIIGQPKSTFDLRMMTDEKKIIIINLSKGRVGEQNANLLGSMLITKIYLAAMSRADISEKELNLLPQFYLYVDEFQSFANESFANILSEARKYKLNLTMAHQYIEQMSDEVRAAVFGNVGSMIVFRVGAYDAEVLEKEFLPTFTSEDIVNLGIFQIYLKLMIDGVTSQPFSATTMPQIARQPVSFSDQIIEMSRKAFARARSEVEKDVIAQSGGQGDTQAPSAAFARSENSPSQTKAQTVPRAQMPQTAPSIPQTVSRPYTPPRPQVQVSHPTQNNAPRPPQQEQPSLAPSEGFSSLKEIATKISVVQNSPKQNQPQVFPQKKAGTEEHKANLRAALSDVLKRQPSITPVAEKAGSGERVVGAKRTSEPEHAFSKTPFPKAESPQNNQAKNEVPEEVLRKILDSN